MNNPTLDFHHTRPDSLLDARLRLVHSVLEPHAFNGCHWVRVQLTHIHDCWLEVDVVEALLKELVRRGHAVYEFKRGYRRLVWE